MLKYGYRKYFVYEHEEVVNAIWHDGFTFWLTDGVKDGFGCSTLDQLISIANNIYDNPSYVPVDSIYNNERRIRDAS